MNLFSFQFFNRFLAVFLITSSLLFFSSCGNNGQQKGALPATVSNYIYAYTSGVISKASAIRVRFVSDVIDAEKVGNEVESDLFNLSPAVEGKAFWQDEKTLTFEPSAYFSSGEEYSGNINLKKIFDNLPQDLKSFDFSFRIQDQFFNVEMEGLQIKNVNNPSSQVFKGAITTGDIAEDQAVEKLLVAKQGGKPLEIEWDHTGATKRHAFVVNNVVREKEESELNLSWNGDPLGVDSKGKETIKIPAVGTFKVLDAKVVNHPEQHLLIVFSDPLQARQELRGFINIEDYNGDFRFDINGQHIRVYPRNRIVGDRKLFIKTGIKNYEGKNMPNESKWLLYFDDVKPKVRLVGKGVILPNSEGLVFPFEAIGLRLVDVEIHKIFNNNILQFLQTNDLEGTQELNRVGRIVMQKKIDLQTLTTGGSFSSWTRYALDLGEMIEEDPGAIYQVIIGFRPDYAVYDCGGTGETENEDLTLAVSQEEEEEELVSIWGDYYGVEGYYNNYQWAHRDDPCFPAYYNYEKFIRQNVFASNLGLIAKKGKDKSFMVAVSDLRTAKPISGVQLEFFDYQQQLIKTVSTDGEGIVNTSFEDETPFFVVASRGTETGYLRLYDYSALSLSRFDVGGAQIQKGMKGYIYGERGVWRPGDSLFLNFILETVNQEKKVNHPVTFEFYDPKGQLQEKRVVVNHVNHVYPFYIKTDPSAPTGNWALYAKVGGASFYKNIKIETVKPNRLKIKLDFGQDVLTASDKKIEGDLQVNWLHGAPAKNLDARIELQLSKGTTTFQKFGNFKFDDPARPFYSEPQVIYDKSVNAEGKASISASINPNLPPGMLKASFRTRVFEKGGDFSVDNFTIPFSPYESYTGILIPKNKYGQNRIDLEKTAPLSFVALDENGKPLANKKLSIGIYRVNWRWWWDRSGDQVSQYNTSNHLDAVQSRDVITNAQGEASWETGVEQWGRYMVRVCDTESGHCSGDFFYAGYPWYGEGDQNRQEAAMLGFMTDKEKYEVGETVKLTIPAGENGRCLISLESGTNVIETHWMDSQAGENTFSFYATAEMAPTVYAHVTLLQPHGQKNNDLPIRLYGVIPISVEDPKTRISPQIAMPDELEPEQSFKVEVKEENGEPMAYTLAVVDEGLLDLTRFKTPDPWSSFYAREALGVKTWDLYDYVLGAYGGELERILSIGGGMGEVEKEDNAVNRFKPVVKHIGPFYLGKGKKASHKLTMPNYIGSVRVMVVAANKGAYGNAEKTVPVRKPLMVLATLPRVLGPTETLSMPVNVFVSDESLKNVSVSVKELTGMANFEGGTSRSLTFNSTGDQMVYFPLKVKEQVGAAKFLITAKSGRQESSQEIEILIRNPNPLVTNIYEKVLDPGASWNQSLIPVGVSGTNKAVLEVSNIPPINIDQRLRFLIHYPHGCIEQTTSTGFPQLYVNQLLEVPKATADEVTENIVATINRIRTFQTSSGGFSYWPGGDYNSFWGTNYAGHFLLEAKALGYEIPETLLDRWIKYQSKVARRWDPGLEGEDNNHLTQAYRLYTLALAGKPEIGAMNRLREMKKSNVVTWKLAGAYAKAGKPEVASQLISNLSIEVEQYRQLGYNYGSTIRDESMILETLVDVNEKDNAGKLLRRIAQKLGEGRWLSTQSIGYGLLAIGKYVGNNQLGEKFTFNYQIGNQKAITAGSNRPVFQVDLGVEENANQLLAISNTSKGVVFIRVISSGKPMIGDPTDKANDLKMEVKYTDTEGNPIKVSQLTQGTDFVAEITVVNPGTIGLDYQEMALTQIFPSGWEILNPRMSNINGVETTIPEYQDVRDDRVYTYFDIRQGKSKTYRIQLNAAYQGRYYLPSVYCEAMYDKSINAQKAGKWVQVVSPGEVN